ncbi:MAG: type II toxin-antitoxin system VapC family toxin [Actinobacteria bacterium]|nr:type II toxin-antitoxin system VapC family toxin [Actinomycetota bacterium]
MIIDASALLAVLLDEPERPTFEAAMSRDPFPRISAASYLEAGIVVDSRRDPMRSRYLDTFLARAEVAIEPVTAEQAAIARKAYQDFGRGSGHPARLNFGDCFAYALAKATDEELLFTGEDFSHTDIRSAVR